MRKNGQASKVSVIGVHKALDTAAIVSKGSFASAVCDDDSTLSSVLGECHGSTSDTEKNVSIWEAFRQGVLIDVLNPKVAVFFMAFLPQFVRPEKGGESMQMVMLGTLVICVAIFVEAFFVSIAARSTQFFRRNPAASVWLDRYLGSILIGLGIRLALSEQRQ